MLVIPVNDTYSQTLTVSLTNQPCTIALYQKSVGVFCDLYVSNSLIIGGVICKNLNRIVRDLYLGFIGDLAFYDTQGASDPSSPGLGTRYLFFYFQLSDLGGLG
jgi:hypothetical protein